MDGIPHAAISKIADPAREITRLATPADVLNVISFKYPYIL